MPDSPEMQIRCITHSLTNIICALRRLCANENRKKETIDAGGTDSLIKVTTVTAAPTVLLHASATLGKLACTDDIRSQITTNGGSRPLVKLLLQHQEPH